MGAGAGREREREERDVSSCFREAGSAYTPCIHQEEEGPSIPGWKVICLANFYNEQILE